MGTLILLVAPMILALALAYGRGSHARHRAR